MHFYSEDIVRILEAYRLLNAWVLHVGLDTNGPVDAGQKAYHHASPWKNGVKPRGSFIGPIRKRY